MSKFNRILLKLSGESLMGKQSFGIDPVRLGEYAQQIKEVHEMGVQIGIVIGGGNIFRGLSGASKGFDRVKGDQMGMCATVINSLALSSALGAIGVKTKVLTAIRMEPIGEFYSKWKAIEAMEAGYVCIFSAGTGSPYFTTDTGYQGVGAQVFAQSCQPRHAHMSLQTKRTWWSDWSMSVGAQESVGIKIRLRYYCRSLFKFLLVVYECANWLTIHNLL